MNITEIIVTPEIAIPNTEHLAPVNQDKISDLIQSFSEKLGLDRTFSLEKIAQQNFSPQELILYQIQASNYHLRIEMISKGTESLLQTFRKVQANQ